MILKMEGSMPHKPVLIMAGGTGGHVYPALAVADYLRRKQIPLFWLGTTKGLEARIVPARGYSLLTINVGGLRGKGIVKWLQAPFVLFLALMQTMLIFFRLKPAVILGMGGFVSGPGGVAAWLMRIPLCIHEQNAVAGLTNRLLAPLAQTVMQAFPGTFPEPVKAKLTGNPVRAEIIQIAAPEQRMHSGMSRKLKLLVLGGSQGARALNRLVPQALLKLPEDIKLEVRHQTGSQFHAETEALYRDVKCTMQLEPFIENMAAAYSWADLVICRAGALTIAELSAAGVASILVPFPFAVDDHQTANARFLSHQGAALLIQEQDLTSDRLCRLLADFYHARDHLLSMAQKARSLARPQATRDVAEYCLEAAYAG
jgi:UDP-N-acetylglucosamine--N-acetylmuramyl-(pentapeptide) pyrophosphoryl-undecaprenol N-acetylglucosamine transferase